MRDLILQIKQSLSANLYYLSLYTVLTLPDICAALMSEDGKTCGEKYKDWFNKYISSKYGGLKGEDVYFFRCSVLHQGSSSTHPKSSFKKIIFIEPNQKSPFRVHNCILNDAFCIDIYMFCNDMISGVEQWLKENEEEEKFKLNYKKFMQRYPEGLAPYIVGVSVIG